MWLRSNAGDDTFRLSGAPTTSESSSVDADAAVARSFPMLALIEVSVRRRPSMACSARRAPLDTGLRARGGGTQVPTSEPRAAPQSSSSRGSEGERPALPAARIGLQCISRLCIHQTTGRVAAGRFLWWWCRIDVGEAPSLSLHAHARSAQQITRATPAPRGPDDSRASRPTRLAPLHARPPKGPGATGETYTHTQHRTHNTRPTRP